MCFPQNLTNNGFKLYGNQLHGQRKLESDFVCKWLNDVEESESILSLKKTDTMPEIV